MSPAMPLGSARTNDRLVRAPTMPEIVRAAAAYFGIAVSQLRGRSGVATIAHARGIAMHLCREDGKQTYSAVGQFFGRDHTTVLQAWKRVAAGDGSELAAIRHLLAGVTATDGQLRLPTVPLTLCNGCELLRGEIAALRAELIELRLKLSGGLELDANAAF